MSAITHALTGKHGIKGRPLTGKGLAATIFSSETCWFTITLLLFLILGPFSAIAAVLGVFSIIPKEGEVQEPEAIRPQ